MTYKLTITKLIANPHYDAQMKEYGNSQNRQWGQTQAPEAQITAGVLDIEVTEETFMAIRKAALETL